MDTVTREKIEKAGMFFRYNPETINTRGGDLCEFSCPTKMNQVQRHSRAASDFSIARILAEDHTRKSRVSSLSATVGVYNDRAENLSQRVSAGPTIDTSSLSGSRLAEESSRLPGLGRTGSDDPFDSHDAPNASRLHSSIIIASQPECSQLSRGARDLRALRIERSELSWLQCTRYRPPKLHRKSAAGKSGKRRPGAHPRIPFTSSQLHVLEEKYRNTAYLSRRDVVQLSTLLRLPQSRVKIWFQNRRARDRRETSISAGNATVLSADVPSARKSQDIPYDNPTAPNPV